MLFFISGNCVVGIPLSRSSAVIIGERGKSLSSSEESSSTGICVRNCEINSDTSFTKQRKQTSEQKQKVMEEKIEVHKRLLD